MYFQFWKVVTFSLYIVINNKNVIKAMDKNNKNRMQTDKILSGV